MYKIIISAIVMASLSFTACNSKTTESPQEQSTGQFACSMHPEVIGNKGDKCSKCGMELTVPVATKAEEHNEQQHADSLNAEPKTETTNVTPPTTSIKQPETKTTNATSIKQPETKTTNATSIKQPKTKTTNATSIKQPETKTTNATSIKQPETKTTNATPPVTVKATFSIKEIVNNYLILKNALTRDDSNAAASAGKALYTIFGKININALDAKQKKEYADIADDAKEHAEHIGDNAGKLDHQREYFALLSKDVQDLIKAFGTEQKLYQDFCPMYNDGKGAIWISELKEIKNPYYGSQMLSCGSMKKEF